MARGRSFAAQRVNWSNFSPSRVAVSARSLGSSHLDLGCGLGPKNPFACDEIYGLDLLPENVVNAKFPGSSGFKYKRGDLSKPLPFEDSTFTSVSAFDVVEHVPRIALLEDGRVGNAFIELMNEIYRVLEPNGVFLAVTPAYPSGAAFQDPTHVNFITRRTVGYFAGSQALAASLGYGFYGRYELLHQSWMRSGRLHKASVPGVEPALAEHHVDARQTTLSRIRSVAPRLKGRIALLVQPTHLIWLLQAIKPGV